MGYNVKFEYPFLDELQPDGTTKKVAQKVDHTIYSNEFKYDQNVVYTETVDMMDSFEAYNIAAMSGKYADYDLKCDTHYSEDYRDYIVF